MKISTKRMKQCLFEFPFVAATCQKLTWLIAITFCFIDYNFIVLLCAHDFHKLRIPKFPVTSQLAPKTLT